MKIVRIYVDGSYNPSEKIGAWAFIIVENNEVVFENSKSFNKKEYSSMTINKMEMHAVHASINYLRSNGYKPNKQLFYLFTDSQYVHLGYNAFLERRKANSNNKTLWLFLEKILESFTEFKSLFIQWIPSDSRDIYHQRAHELCQISMKNYLNNKINVVSKL